MGCEVEILGGMLANMSGLYNEKSLEGKDEV